ncbi:hypothetical protein PQR66_08630 [Paraburkholderia agricolaris]|uniref:Uncharacterized protein n=1 Tax=Paraburkholderia agricolaris TaxID=2152888 RepID=A0ABW8ZJQ7_9BURK
MSTIYQQASAIIDYARDHRRSVCTCDRQNDTAASHHAPGCRYRHFVEASVTLDELSSNKPAVAQDARQRALEEAAAAVEKHDVEGREWIPNSLWATLTREAASRIRALAACPAAPAPSGGAEKWVAKVRVTANGYAMELSEYIAYALPEGVHELYASPQPASGGDI